MSTKEQLESALKQAMKDSDVLKKNTLRMALSAIRLAEIDQGKPLEEAQVQAILQKEVKSRHESIADAQRAGRPDLIAEAQDEIAVLETFLPKQMSAEELASLVRETIDAEGATSMKDMGRVMKALMPRLQGRATGEQASAAVKEQLSVPEQ